MTKQQKLQRAELASEVFRKVFEETHTFRQDNLGSDLAYLLGAILDFDDPRAFTNWRKSDSDCAETLIFFRRLFPRSHRVWDFIEC